MLNFWSKPELVVINVIKVRLRGSFAVKTIKRRNIVLWLSVKENKIDWLSRKKIWTYDELIKMYN